MKTFSRKADRESVGALLRNLRFNFNDAFEVDVIDPRCLLWFFDFIKYKVRTTEPTWVLDGKVIYRGIPAWEELEKILRDTCQDLFKDTAVKGPSS